MERRYASVQVHEDDKQEKVQYRKDFIGILSSWNNAFNVQIVRDFQYSIQMTTALVTAALVGFISDYKNQAPIGWILPVTAAIFLFDTLGGTMAAFIGAAINLFPIALVIYIFQRCGMGYEDYTSGSILFCLLCFYCGFINPSILTRKISLLFPAVIFPTLITTPRSLIAENFIWQVCGELCLSLSLALAVALFMFPRYASVEIHDRCCYSFDKIGKVFELSILAIMSKTKVESEVYLMEADQLLQTLYYNQDIINRRTAIAKLEPSRLLRFLFRSSSQPRYSNYETEALRGMAASLLWHSHSMIHAIKQLHYHKFHTETVEHSQSIFYEVATQFQIAIKAVRQERPSNRFFAFFSPYAEHSSYSSVQVDSIIEKLLDCCDNCYKVLSLAVRQIDHLVKEEAVADLTSISGRTKDLEGRGEVEGGKEWEEYDLDAEKRGNRLIFSFFLFHMSEMIQMIYNKFHTESIQHHFLHLRKKQEKEKQEKKEIAKPTKEKVSLFQRIYLIFTAIGHAIYEFHANDAQTKLATALRTALIMMVGFTFVETPDLSAKFEQGQWILLAMVNSQGDNFGGNLSQIRLRLLGTMLGAIYSYFTYVAVTNNNPENSFDITDTQTFYYVLAMLVPFSLLCGMIKQNADWGYFGSIALTTTMIVTFGRNPYLGPPPANYSLLRIQQNAVGICLLFTCNIVSIPVLALDLLKLNLRDSLAIFNRAVKKLWNVYEEDIQGKMMIVSEGEGNAGAMDLSGADYSENGKKNDDDDADVLTSKASVPSYWLSTDSERLIVKATNLPDLFQDHHRDEDPDTLTSTRPASPSLSSRKNNNAILTITSATFTMNHETTLQEVHQIGLKQRFQTIQYILQENLAFYRKLLDQRNLTIHASFEILLSNRPFSATLYDSLLLIQIEFIQLLKSFDRIFCRICSFQELTIFQKIVSFFLKKFSFDLKQLFQKISLAIELSMKELEKAIIIPDDFLQNLLAKLFYQSNLSSSTGNAPTSSQPSPLPLSSSSSSARSSERFKKHDQHNHIDLLKQISHLSIKLFSMSHEFNHEIFTNWFSEVLMKSGLLTYEFEFSTSIDVDGWLAKEARSVQKSRNGPKGKTNKDSLDEEDEEEERGIELMPAEEQLALDLERGPQNHQDVSNNIEKQFTGNRKKITSAMVIHRLFDILTTFNGLFYTASHLGKNTIKLVNTVMTIIDVERSSKHKSY